MKNKIYIKVFSKNGKSLHPYEKGVVFKEGKVYSADEYGKDFEKKGFRFSDSFRLRFLDLRGGKIVRWVEPLGKIIGNDYHMVRTCEKIKIHKRLSKREIETIRKQASKELNKYFREMERGEFFEEDFLGENLGRSVVGNFNTLNEFFRNLRANTLYEDSLRRGVIKKEDLDEFEEKWEESSKAIKMVPNCFISKDLESCESTANFDVSDYVKEQEKEKEDG